MGIIQAVHCRHTVLGIICPPSSGCVYQPTELGWRPPDRSLQAFSAGLVSRRRTGLTWSQVRQTDEDPLLITGRSSKSGAVLTSAAAGQGKRWHDLHKRFAGDIGTADLLTVGLQPPHAAPYSMFLWRCTIWSARLLRLGWSIVMPHEIVVM